MFKLDSLKLLIMACALNILLPLAFALAALPTPPGKPTPPATAPSPARLEQSQPTTAQPLDGHGEREGGNLASEGVKAPPAVQSSSSVPLEQDATRPDSYIQMLIATVADRWTVPAVLTPGELTKLQATVCLKIDDNGHLVEVKLVQASGNSLFDGSLLTTLGSIKEWPRPQGRFANAARIGRLCPSFTKTGPGVQRWKFATFFNQIKAAVAEEWHPNELLSHHDPSGKIYGTGDLTTVLSVQLGRDGRIVHLRVARSSGVNTLDEEAMSACRRAQPFAPPPQSLIESDGVIRFQFGFIVQPGRSAIKFYP